jgi:branched-chain amino acid transport system ATP-binding protein
MTAVSNEQASGAVLELADIKAGYGDSVVLRNLSLAVAPGTVVALLGPNGAGKTTLLRVAAGLVRPMSGRVGLRGVDVTKRSPAARARMKLCLVPEGRGIFPSLTVRENIHVRVERRRDRNEAIERIVSVFPALRDRLGQVAGTMSGGQQQMLAMARCYIGSPEVILLDEVSMGLAPLVVDEIYETIAQLARAGTSLLLVEQYVDRVLAIAHVVHVMNRGVIEFSGAPNSISRTELMEKYLHIAPAATAINDGPGPPGSEQTHSASGAPSGAPSFEKQE